MVKNPYFPYKLTYIGTDIMIKGEEDLVNEINDSLPEQECLFSVEREKNGKNPPETYSN